MIRGYNHSELHIIAAIGDLEQPNVTSLAEHMGMTGGGIWHHDGWSDQYGA